MRIRAVTVGAVLCLAGCAGIYEPRTSMDENGPAPINGASQQPPGYTLFKAAYDLALLDDLGIAKGWAAPGTARTPLPAIGFDPTPIPTTYAQWTGLHVSDGAQYSPLDFCTYTTEEANQAKADATAATTASADAQQQLTIANTNVTNTNKVLATATGANVATAQTNYNNALGKAATALSNLTAANAAAASKAAIALKAQYGQPKPGCSYQSQHARAMAVRGFALIDQNCDEFFRSKGLVQQNVNTVNDVSSTLAGAASGAAGLATGGAVAPSVVGLFTSVTTGGSTILNKDFLFGQANIKTTYDLVTKAMAADVGTALPEPDTSDWTYKQAVAVIRAHESICRPPYILALMQAATAGATPQAKPASSATSGTNNNPVTGGSRPADRSTIMTVTSPGAAPATQ